MRRIELVTDGGHLFDYPETVQVLQVGVLPWALCPQTADLRLNLGARAGAHEPRDTPRFGDALE